MQFDIKKDIDLVNAGTHFWCKACITARLLEEKSPDSRYCRGCFDILSEEAALLPHRGINRRPAWIPRKDTSAATQTLINATGNNTAQVIQGDTSDYTLPSFETIEKSNDKHAGGRPRKSGEVSRVTAWRRGKEQLQAVMI